MKTQMKTLKFRDFKRVGQDHKAHKHQNHIEPWCMNWFSSGPSALGQEKVIG